MARVGLSSTVTGSRASVSKRDWLDEDALKADLVAEVPQVLTVHHVHAWMLTQERPLMTLHTKVTEGADHYATLMAIKAFLKARYNIDHATIQIEPSHCPDDGPTPPPT